MTNDSKLIRIHDDGQEAADAVFEKDAKGNLKKGENGAPILKESAKEARAGWAEGNNIYVKRQCKAGDTNEVQMIQIKTQMKTNGNSPELDFSIEIYDQRIAYAAVLVKRIEGDWLLDQLDDAAALLGPNGEMPDMLADRVTVAKEFPAAILSYTDNQIAEKCFLPLAVSATPSGEPTNDADSGPGLTTVSTKKAAKQ